MKLGFICPNPPGHLNPMAALARHLQARNHDVVFLYSSGAAGLPFVPDNERDHFNEEDPGSTQSPLASITQVPRAFDFESSHWPSQFHHTGPFHDGRGRDKVGFPWERLTGEPLIYASMGTVLNGRFDVFRTIVAGVAKHKDLQLVLSVGDQVDPEQIGPAPSNAIIVKQAPLLELLKQTSVCITHAGLNTVLESLAHGVLQVAIPVAYDQPAVAARIAHKQTGVVTSLDKLTADHLSTLLNEVLNDATYLDNARKFQKAIAKANGLSVAADLVEDSLGVHKKAKQQLKAEIA
jgi:MGT family glycosyltransferase